MSARTATGSASDTALARSLVYRLLSQVFAYPMPDVVAELLHDDLPLALAQADALPAEVSKRLDALADALGEAGAAELESAYREVFSHIHSADCPMFETDYGARDVWRHASVLADIAGFYRAFGVREHGERPDHVSAELEFLHVLAYKQAWATAQGHDEHAAVCRDAEAAFLRDHALTWLPGFAARAEAIGRDGVYARAGRLASVMFEAEAGRLGLRVAEELAPRAPETTEEGHPAFCEAEP